MSSDDDKKRVFLRLTDKDFRENVNAYDPDQVVYSILAKTVNLRTVAKTQVLTPYICAKYVIFGGNDEKYGRGTEDRWLDDDDILELQPHITQEELTAAHILVAKEEEAETTTYGKPTAT